MPARKSAARPARLSRSARPVANALDSIGDKRTLIAVRDLLFSGKRRYRELAQSPEGLPSNILAQRLRRLENEGLVSRAPYQENPVRYEYQLTRMGTDLLPVLKEIVVWSNKHIPGTAKPPRGFFNR